MMRESLKNPKVSAVLAKEKTWHKEFAALRAIVLDCKLAEDLKWGQACYSLDGKNVVLIHGFKEYCALLFMKGALLKDPKGILIQQTKNVQSARQIRFTNVSEIVKLKSALKGYIENAIAVEKAGLKVVKKETSDFEVPEELQLKLDEMPALAEAFHALTPGRQRAYLLFFNAPKQSATRASRIEKCVPRILKGKGLND